MTAQEDFKEFMKRRQVASDAFLTGNAEPLARISGKALPATLFGPKGDCIQGAAEVDAANAKGAQQFASSSRNSFEVMHMGAGDDVAYWVGVQRSVVEMRNHEGAIPIDLRVTEIFRREGNEWKLVHRHADKLQAA
jgi:ketosteroid isomerase-like protein